MECPVFNLSMQVYRGKGHTLRKGRIVVDYEFVGTSNEMGQPKS